jgi:hypothetical protein
MTQQRARADLIAAVDDMWSAVCEFVLIALEDAPTPSDLAVVDDFVDSVSALQGDVAACRELLSPDSPALSVPMLADLQHQLAETSLRYWHDIRAYEPTAQLRSAARKRGGEWTAWFGSVQESATRCAAPLQAAEAACHLAWGELAELQRGPVRDSESLPTTDPMTIRRTP